jgi:SulP family sulfate permease
MASYTFHRPVPRLLKALKGYTKADLVSDIGSGLTVGLIALPLAMALGIASIRPGVETPFPPPAMGIFTAIIAGFLISALGGSRVQIGGPTAAFIPIVLLIVEQHGIDGLMIATMMAGVILIVMGLTRMGTLIKFIPYPVTSGFTTGIAVAIMASQSGDFLGLNSAEAPREFVHKVGWLASEITNLNPGTVLVAVGCVVLIALWPKFGLKRVPGSIVAMLLSTVVVTLFGLDAKFGIETVGSQFPGGVPGSLPPLQFPDISLDRIRELIGPAVAIALLGGIESLLSAVVSDGLVNDRHDSNTELVAQGVANLVCPLFCGLPATGAIARTTANVSSGARSPISGMVHAITLLLIVLLFSRFAQFVPMAAMAAVLVLVAFRMGEWHELARVGRMPRGDAAVLLTTFALTVLFDLVVAVEVGMVLAAVLFIHRISETTEVARVTESDELEVQEQLVRGREIPEGVLVYRIFGPFLFGAAEKMEEAVASLQRLPKVLILRMQLVPVMDATALNALESMVERMQHAGGTVILSGPHHQPLDVMRKAGFIDKVGRKNIRANFDQALARAREILGESKTAPDAGA